MPHLVYLAFEEKDKAEFVRKRLKEILGFDFDLKEVDETVIAALTANKP